MKQWFFPLLAVFFVAGCQSTGPSVALTKKTLMPAKMDQMNEANDLFIAEIKGQGKKLLDEDYVHSTLQEQLGRIMVENQNRFNMVSAQAADTLITVHYDLNVKTVEEMKKTKKCVQKETKNEDKDNINSIKGCAVWKYVREGCVKTTVKLTLKPAAISVKNNTLTFAKSYDSEQTLDRCTGIHVEKKITDPILAKVAFLNALTEFRQDIAPYYLSEHLLLINSDDADLTGNKQAIFDEAMTLARSEKFMEACKTFAETALYLDESPAVLYNTGVCWEVEGKEDAALGYYQKAKAKIDLLADEDKTLVIDAIARLQNQTPAN